MLCVTGVYLRDITSINFIILYLNVSHPSACSSCSLFLLALIVFFCFFLNIFMYQNITEGDKTAL